MQLNGERQIRIVVADDHAVVRAGISTALSDLPNVAIVAEVGDGPGVLAALDLQPDALVIDVSMPQFEPLQTIRQIRMHYPQLKILVVSAYDDDVYVQGLLQAGVDGYQLKDQPLADIRLALQRVLAGERWVCTPLLSKLMRGVPVVETGLTPRQRELLWCLQQGDDNHAIARRIGLSVKTVENHLTRLYRQIGVQSRLEAVHYAAQHPQLPMMPTSSQAITPNQALSVLIVDDNLRYRQHVSRMISKMQPNCAVVEAAHQTEAMAAISQRSPDLALVDVVLGDEDGISCAAQIKQQSPNTRVLLVSAYPDREFHRRGLAVGAVALLDKKDLDAAALRLLLEDV